VIFVNSYRGYCFVAPLVEAMSPKASIGAFDVAGVVGRCKACKRVGKCRCCYGGE